MIIYYLYNVFNKIFFIYIIYTKYFFKEVVFYDRFWHLHPVMVHDWESHGNLFSRRCLFFEDQPIIVAPLPSVALQVFSLCANAAITVPVLLSVLSTSCSHWHEVIEPCIAGWEMKRHRALHDSKLNKTPESPVCKPELLVLNRQWS